MPANIADAGMVRIHAHTILRAVIHLTLAACSTAPTPIIEPAITWVVLTGIPKCDVPMSTSADAELEQNPSISRILVMLVPMVLTMRHPPNTVPREIAV